VLFLLVGCPTEQSKPDRLAKIATEEKRTSVRYAAVEKLTDQALLAKIAVEDKAESVRYAAVENLTDQAVLAKIAVEDKAESVRIAAVEKLTDQAVLARVATEDERSFVRYAAVEKLTDQAVLAKIAVHDWHSDVRRAAAENLTDQAVLTMIATEGKSTSVRIAAVKNLIDQAVLTMIAAEDWDSEVRHAAVEKLTDQAVLTKIAAADWDSEVRHAAMEKLTDQAVKPSDLQAAAPVTEEDPPKTETPELSPVEPAELKPPAAGVAPTPQVTVEPGEVIKEPDKEAEILASASSERPSAPEMPPGGTFTINLASFRQKQKADLYVEELKKLGIHAYSWEVNLPENGRWYRVSVGGFLTLKEAKNYTKQLRQEGISDVYITKIAESS
jgi:cell division protein FtsN